MTQQYSSFTRFAICASLAFSLFSGVTYAQLPISKDNAGNYAANEWQYNSNKGTGFTAWQLPNGSPTSGYFLGSSTDAGFGDINTAGHAFSIYGYDGQGASAARYFRGTGSVADPGDARSFLLAGQVFSIDIAVAFRNGYKGINITSDDGSDRFATFAVDGNNYRFGDPDNATFVSVNDVFPYDEESVFRIEAYQLTENTCMVTLTRNGVTVSTQIQTGNIGGFNIYEGSTSSDDPKNRIYFNNLLIERRCLNVTIWDGTAWSNGLPSLDKRAIVTADLPITADMSMCTLHIIGEAEVTVASGINLTVANEVNITATATLIVENNANLVQIDNVPNTGTAIIKRNSSAIQRLDYTMWSSPVTGQNLFDFSNETVPTRFYSYNTTTNHFEIIPGLGEDSTTLFIKGHGYHIRMPNNHPTTPTVWEGEFRGLPNNGTAVVPLVTSNDQDFRFNMVGNPYPSAISIERFIERNRLVITGELWFWRKTNDPLKSSYCTITNAGYAGNVDLIDSESYDPQGIINTGQGFIVKAISGAPVSLIFNNSLREANNNDNFFRMSNTETSPTHMNRFWLNIKKEGSAYGQVLVNYMTGATNEIDHGIDGRAMGDGEVSLYTIAADQKLVIQGRQLPFEESDAVEVGFKANAAGTYSIVLDKFEGVFTGQAIYIKDNLLGTYNNIKEGAYEFVTEAGTFDDRFEVVYVNQALGTNDNVIVANEIIVFKQNTDLNVNSGSAIMQSIKVFDLRGRTLYENTAVNSSETVIGNLGVKDQVVIVQVNTDKGTVSKKVIL